MIEDPTWDWPWAVNPHYRQADFKTERAVAAAPPVSHQVS